MKMLKTIYRALLLLVLLSSCSPSHEKALEGMYEPTWESLAQYDQAPDWFRDAKFGIWALGPAVSTEQGWYARFMYDETVINHNWHVKLRTSLRGWIQRCHSFVEG